MDATSTLTNQLLIAMPGMADPNFSSTVTLICEHNEDGALGIIINRPLTLRLGGLFEQLDVNDADSAAAKDPVLLGGPVEQERGFVLHESTHSYENSLAVSKTINLTLSRDILDAMATGAGPRKSLVALGYAGWEAGQLEHEMLANAWLNVPATPEIVFDLPFADRWSAAAETARRRYQPPRTRRRTCLKPRLLGDDHCFRLWAAPHRRCSRSGRHRLSQPARHCQQWRERTRFRTHRRVAAGMAPQSTRRRHAYASKTGLAG